MSNKNRNASLRKAAKVKNDEFYTQLHDIENEMRHYVPHFKGKKIYMNTDHPDYSNFWLHFKLLFDFYNLKSITSTFWNPDGKAFKTVYDGKEEIRTPLEGDGDFRSDECVAILEESDLIITNPPFSLFRDFIRLLRDKDKKFLIMGNLNDVIYKDVFPMIKNNKMWPGPDFRKTMEFRIPNDIEIETKSGRVDADGNKFMKVQGITWWTNLDYPKRYDDLLLWASYKGSEDKYPYYDNYNAINVDKVSWIPYDFDGVMGVPISFIGHWNPNQFEILGFTNTGEENPGIRLPNTPHGRAVIDGREIYTRILIKNRNPVDEITI